MSSRKRKPAAVLSLVDRLPAPAKLKWTPLQLLKDLIAEIESGKVVPTSMMVFFMDEDEKGNRHPHTWSHGTSYAEAIAFCELEKQRTLADWRNT